MTNERARELQEEGAAASQGLLYLSRDDILALQIDMHDVVSVVEEAFRLKGCGQVLMPPKVTMSGQAGAFVQVMPAWVAGGAPAGTAPAGTATAGTGALGLKLVTVFPDNQTEDVPTTNAVIVLDDPRTGLPLAIMDGGLITALRTGASVGAAARHLAVSDARTTAVLGCGVQARSAVRALADVLPALDDVRYYDVEPRVAAAFAAELAVEFPDVRFIPCEDPGQVCHDAQVVVTAITMGTGTPPPLGSGLLEPGALAVALDYDAAWAPAAMAECERFVTDDVAQTRATKAHGEWLARIPTVHADLGKVIAGLSPGRTAHNERVFCLNLGIAVEDVVCARLLYERALAAGAGVRL